MLNLPLNSTEPYTKSLSLYHHLLHAAAFNIEIKSKGTVGYVFNSPLCINEKAIFKILNKRKPIGA